MNASYEIIVLGAGPGGLLVAKGAAKANKRVLLIDRGTWGGNSANFGCIPSKTLLRLAADPSFHPETALAHTKATVARLRHDKEPLALQELGIITKEGLASFCDPYTIAIATKDGGLDYASAQTIVIATGSRPWIPKIAGLDSICPLTHESIFLLDTLPKHLAILGGGPIGCELAQAFSRLGTKVCIIDYGPVLLAKEDPLIHTLLSRRFEKEGIDLFLGAEVKAVQKVPSGIHLDLFDAKKNSLQTLIVTDVLIAAGRRPNIGDLKLDAAGINYSHQGISVDEYGRTSQKHIYALGDVCGGLCFTHTAEHQARAIVSSLLFPLKKKIDATQAVPRVTFTDPELASVGLTEKEAIEMYGEDALASYTVFLSEIDRAKIDEYSDGFVKIVTKKWSSHILGATIASPRGAEMIAQIAIAMEANMPLRKLANVMQPYPSYATAIQVAAEKWFSDTLLPPIRSFFS